ncbi:MAG: hypothetical protein AMJ68_03205 [Acidithiobacillales bacterium SG8_45]|nr:MAG: hypothetical protein AMJ68_03205 [Acidithiobacillales bacterium SG8_45]
MKRVHRLISTVLVPVTFLLLAGCSAIEVGNDFDMQAFENRVKQNVSTRVDVKNWLGKPGSTGTVVNSDGSRREKWVYFYGTGSVSGKTPATIKMLEVQFDDSGKVTSYNWSR